MIKEKFLKRLNLQVADIFIIDCIQHGNRALLDTALNYDPVIKIRYSVLKGNGSLVEQSPGSSVYVVNEDLVAKMYKDSPMKKAELDSFVADYRSIFPKGSNRNGYPYKGDKQGCTVKMRTFLKANPEYSKDVVLQATRKYINEKRKDGYDYMHLAHYFIEKNNVSALGALCEQIVNGESDDNDYKNIIDL